MPSDKRTKRRPPPKRDNNLLVFGAIGLALVFVGVLVFINLNAQPPTVTVSASKIWGNPNAPVTVEDWSDFR